MAKAFASGTYFNDYILNNPDFADGWYIRKAKNTSENTREMLIDMKLRGSRLNGIAQTELDLYRPLETGYSHIELEKPPHLDYKHKKGKNAHLYAKIR